MLRTKRPSQAAPPAPAASAFVPPYPASWIDRFTRWVDRLPGPFWAYYLVGFLGLAISLASVHWVVGAYPAWSFHPLHVMVAMAVPLLLLLFTYFHQTAVRSIDDFRPAFQGTPDEFLDFRYRISSLPSWAALAAGVLYGLGVMLVAAIPGSPAPVALERGAIGFLGGLLRVVVVPLRTGPVALAASTIILSWMASGAFFYQLLRQLGIISDLYTHHSNVDLFHLAPLYAFSRHTARVAIAGLITVGLVYLLVPTLFVSTGSRIITVLSLLAFGGVFLLPQLGVHRLLVKEKERMIAENGSMLKVTIADLHHRVTTKRLAQAEELNHTMASLEIERAALTRIPTWPWAPETLRSVVAALLFPIVVWATQEILGRVIGG